MTVASILSSTGTSLTSAVELVWDLITANAMLIFFLGCSIVGIGFKFFKKAKGAAK